MNSEYYVIAISKIEGSISFMGLGSKFYVVVPTRKKLAELYSIMPTEKYRVDSITALNDTKSFEEFRQELTKGEDNKPTGLNFGD